MGGAPLRLPALPSSEVDRSRLRDRAVFVIDRSGTSAHEVLARELGKRPGVARVVSTGVFSEGVPTLLGNHQLSQDAGLGTLAPIDVLLAAARRLLDDLLAGSTQSGLVVEHSSVASTDPMVVRALYPDATLVVIGDRAGADGAGVADLGVSATDVRRSPRDTATAVTTAAERAGAPPPADGASELALDDLRDRLVLVFGVPRSGTTWLEQLLLAHERTAGVSAAETWMFRGIHGFWNNHEGGAGLHATVERATLAAALRRFCDELFLFRLRQVPGASHFVEKTPGHARMLPWISAVYPDAWYVHLVRDGRDVSRSIAEMVHGTADVREAAQAWASTVREVDARRSFIARFLEVRYEDLLSDPQGRAAALLEWVGLDVTAPDREAIAAEARLRVSRHGTSGPVGSGKWTSMTSAERRIVLVTAGDELVRRGYATVGEVRAARRALRRPRAALAEAGRRAGLTSGRPPRG